MLGQARAKDAADRERLIKEDYEMTRARLDDDKQKELEEEKGS